MPVILAIEYLNFFSSHWLRTMQLSFQQSERLLDDLTQHHYPPMIEHFNCDVLFYAEFCAHCIINDLYQTVCMWRFMAEIRHIGDMLVKPSLSCSNTDDLTWSGLSFCRLRWCGFIFISHRLSTSQPPKLLWCITSFPIFVFYCWYIVRLNISIMKVKIYWLFMHLTRFEFD